MAKSKDVVKLNKKKFNRLMTYKMEAVRHLRKHGNVFPPKIDKNLIIGWSKKKLLEFKEKVKKHG